MKGKALCIRLLRWTPLTSFLMFLRWSRAAPAVARIPIPAVKGRGGVVVPAGTGGRVVIVACVVGETVAVVITVATGTRIFSIEIVSPPFTVRDSRSVW